MKELALLSSWLVLDQHRVKLQQQSLMAHLELKSDALQMHARVTWGAHEKSPDLHICRQITIILGCLGALELSQSELNHCQLLGYSQQSSSAEGFKAENCVLLRQFTASLWTPICMPAPALVWVHYDWTDLIPMWYNIAYVPRFEDRGRTSLQR